MTAAEAAVVIVPMGRIARKDNVWTGHVSPIVLAWNVETMVAEENVGSVLKTIFVTPTPVSFPAPPTV